LPREIAGSIIARMPRSDTPQQQLERLGAVVRAILIRKSGMSLAADDTRHDNVDALELMQEVMARLWERIADDSTAVADITAYAATVTHNAWSDHLRRKYPQRTRLKNRLRYFLDHQRGYAMWNGEHGEPMAGRHGWQLESRAPAAAGRIAALAGGQERLPRGSVPRKPLDQFDAADWDRLIGAVLDRVAAPVAVDDLVAIAAELLGLREDRTDSLDDDDNAQALAIADDAARGPEAQVETRGLLRQLWAAILTLKPDYRRAYLLNLPGPGKTRADLDVFVIHGVASLADIDAALDLTEAQYRRLLASIDLEAGERFELERCNGSQELFCLLWRHLPLADAMIAGLLGLEQQQVINRRMLALRELARLVAHRPRPGAAT
jgi:RNA polymerase sigma factor (sigma-70 family)